MAAKVAEYQAIACRCEYCGTADGRMVIDHIIPKSRGGADTSENFATACEPCNRRKAAGLGWITMDGRVGAYAAGPVEPIRRRRRANLFKGHAGSGFL